MFRHIYGITQAQKFRSCVWWVALFVTSLANAATAAPADNVSVVRSLANSVGPVLGSVKACPNIPQSRVLPIADEFRLVIKRVSSSEAEQEELARLFESSVAEGSKAIASGKLDCEEASRQLAELEQSLSKDPTQSSKDSTPSSKDSTPSGSITVPPSRPALPKPPAATTLAAANTTQGVTDTEIRFGIVVPLSGAFEAVGRQMKIGIDTAFNRTNDAGGINGRMLRLIPADDQSDPALTPGAMKQLYEQEKVFGFIGNVGTATAAAAVPFVLKQRVLLFGAFTGAQVLRNDPPDRYVFNYRASSNEEIQAIVQYLLKVRRLQPRQIAVFSAQDAYGDDDFAAVAKAIRKHGMDESGMIRLSYNRNTLNVDDAVKHLRSPNMEAKESPKMPARQIKAVIMFAPYRMAAKFIERTRDLYPAMMYANMAGVGTTKLADELTLLGPRFTRNVVVTQVAPPVSGYSNAVLDYKKALAKYFPGEKPAYVSLEAYIAASILIEAMKRVEPPASLDTEKLVDALEDMRGVDLGLGTELSFGRTEHQASHKVWGSTIDQQGQYVPLDLQ